MCRIYDAASEVWANIMSAVTTGGKAFPTIPLLRTYSAEENIKIIKRCLAENKDVYELGYLPDPSLPENIDTYFD